jgi:hypothetical protein
MKKRSEEQNVAANGSRRLRLESGVIVVVSISIRRFVKCPNQQYAYLQFKTQGRTITKYVGRATAESRIQSLQIGWTLLRRRRLAEKFGWRWVGGLERNNSDLA